MNDQKEVSVIVKKLTPIAERAQNIEIKDEKSMKEAVEVLSELNKVNDKIVSKKEEYTKPLNELLKKFRATWKPLETMYTEAIESVREKMTIYQTEQVRLQKEESAKIAARVGEGKGHFKIETAVTKLAEVKVPEKEIATSSGLVQFREVKVLKITNRDLIPLGYLIVDEAAVLKALKLGTTVPGAELETKQVPANYR